MAVNLSWRGTLLRDAAAVRELTRQALSNVTCNSPASGLTPAARMAIHMAAMASTCFSRCLNTRVRHQTPILDAFPASASMKSTS